MTEKKKVAILGSTGSVGTQALDVVVNGKYETVLLTGGRNVKLLAKQIRQTGCKAAAVSSDDASRELKTLVSDLNVNIYAGDDGICEAVRECGADVIVHSISGMAGIPSAIEASRTGSRLAIANKESIISVGELIFDNIKRFGGELIPVDSEHSAIFQCLLTSGAISADGQGKPEIVKRILLTASGGPFFGKTREELSRVTPEMALNHPTWSMGQKITVDSATLMNKGFEIIEACRLFGVDIERVEVLVHRQSIIHSMVEYIDNMVMAQLGAPDMRHCIRYAVSYPERLFVEEAGLDFAAVGSLTFAKPDTEAFPLLNTAVEAYKKGGTAPASLIAADEAAVGAFLAKKIGFNDISSVVAKTLDTVKVYPDVTPNAVFDADREARDAASAIISHCKKGIVS